MHTSICQVRQIDLLEPDAPDPISVANGLGVNSMAMLVLMAAEGIRPDLILFADTGNEWPETLAYRDLVMRPWLRAVGFPAIVEVRYVPRHGRYTTLEESCLHLQTLPSLAYGRKACSAKWKIQPQQRYERGWTPALRAWAQGGRIEKWIGYDAGAKDMRRGHDLADDRRYRYRYPLCERLLTREACVEVIRTDATVARIARAAGMDPVPRKSACWMCPSNTTQDVRDLVDYHPDLADRIIVIEATAAPKLHTIDGLWRRPHKGARGTEPRPGDMTTFIRAYRAERGDNPAPALSPAA